jgi:hypothetical protein
VIPKIVTAVTIAAAAIGITPLVAEAQARGIMQVSAKVVANDEVLLALRAARTAASSAARPGATRSTETAPTVARVSVVRDPRSIVVTIDYSRS